MSTNRQIEQRLQNGPITKSGVLPVTTLVFRNICSSFTTSQNKVNLIYQPPKCLYSYFS